MEETVKVSFFSHPLFSCFITLYTLTLIFFPHGMLQILFSPVLLISGFLLLSLLRLGTTQESNNRPVKSVNLEEDGDSKRSVSKEPDSYTKPDSMGDFVEWNLRAPLDVIYEAYEEGYDDDEEEENPSVSGEKDPTRLREIERFPSLSLCYPESDSESDSASSSEFNFPEIGDWISPEKMRYRWEEEEEEEEDGIGGGGLIEIKLEENNRKLKTMRNVLDFHGEEEGLIEIDLFQ